MAYFLIVREPALVETLVVARSRERLKIASNAIWPTSGCAAQARVESL